WRGVGGPGSSRWLRNRASGRGRGLRKCCSGSSVLLLAFRAHDLWWLPVARGGNWFWCPLLAGTGVVRDALQLAGIAFSTVLGGAHASQVVPVFDVDGVDVRAVDTAAEGRALVGVGGLRAGVGSEALANQRLRVLAWVDHNGIDDQGVTAVAGRVGQPVAARRIIVRGQSVVLLGAGGVPRGCRGVIAQQVPRIHLVH